MKTFLSKMMFVALIMVSISFTTSHHPLFVSVTEIEQNAKEKTLEISCKIFTDDFEKTLRAAYKTKVDLLDAKMKLDMNKLVNDYIQKHLSISVDDKSTSLHFIGFEKIDEAIYSYFEITNIATVKKINMLNDILYEYKKDQIGIVHCTIAGSRQSVKLNNPEKKVEMKF